MCAEEKPIRPQPLPWRLLPPANRHARKKKKSGSRTYSELTRSTSVRSGTPGQTAPKPRAAMPTGRPPDFQHLAVRAPNQTLFVRLHE